MLTIHTRAKKSTNSQKKLCYDINIHASEYTRTHVGHEVSVIFFGISTKIERKIHRMLDVRTYVRTYAEHFCFEFRIALDGIFVCE